MYVNDTREITVSPIEQGISVELIPTKIVEGVPKFKEHYLLTKGALRVSISAQKTEEVKLPFCFGYHPYLEIDNEEIKDLKLETDIKVQLKLDEVSQA